MSHKKNSKLIENGRKNAATPLNVTHLRKRLTKIYRKSKCFLPVKKKKKQTIK